MSVINPYRTDPMFHQEPDADESFDIFLTEGRTVCAGIVAACVLLYAVIGLAVIPAVTVFYPLFWLYKKVKR